MRAVIFDLDGTLLDNTPFHTAAWMRAFQECGIVVPSWRIHRHIGMGADNFLPALIGRDDPAIEEAHSRHVAPFDEQSKFFEGTAELLVELHRRDFGIALATSSAAEGTETSLARLGDARAAFDHVVTRDDVEDTKPAPDLIAVALQKLGSPPEETVMIGDTRWDGEAARRCGAGFIGVRTGGWSAEELMAAGAVAVYDSVTQLLQELDTSPLG